MMVKIRHRAHILLTFAHCIISFISYNWSEETIKKMKNGGNISFVTTTLLLLNCLDGFDFRRATDRRRGAERLIVQLGADVVALNELNHWDESDLASMASRSGCHSSFLGRASRSGYHVGVLLRDPAARVVEMNSSAPFHHALLLVRACLPAGGTDCVDTIVAVTHGNPHSAMARRDEMAAIAQRAEAFARQGVPFVVLGDLNTLSPHDRAHLERPAVARALAATPRLRQKFLDNADAASVGAPAAPDFEPMQRLHASGLREVATQPNHCPPLLGSVVDAAASPPPPSIAACVACTVPTSPHAADHMHLGVGLRLDYILTSALASFSADEGRYAPLACVVHSDPPLSDHAAIVARLTIASGGGDANVPHAEL